MNIYRLQEIEDLITSPADSDKFAHWIAQSDVIPFLETEIDDEYVILFAVTDYAYISAMLIPDREEITSEEYESLLAWQPLSSSSWGVWSGGDRTWLESALEGERAELMRQGEILFFQRGFEGDSSLGSYFELSQKLSHILGLHYLQGRKAWCRLDAHGDIEEVVKLFQSDDKLGKYTILAIQRDALAEYAGLTQMQLLRMFDFTRLKMSSFNGWGTHSVKELPAHPTIKGKIGVLPNHASYTRGVQIVPLAVSQEELHRRQGSLTAHDRERKYETFIAHDIKHNQIAELS